VLLLLGTHDEIEDVLVKERELPQEFEPNAFRSRLPQDTASFKRDPLTFHQMSLLRRPKNAVTILAGCAAAGFDDIPLFLKKTVDGDFLTILEGGIDRQRFIKALDSLKDRSVSGTTVLVVPADLPWNDNWLKDASDRVSRLSSKDKFAHILFLADPTTTYQMINDDSSLVSLADISVLSLHPWHDAFLRQWLQDCELPNDPSNRKEVSQQTGNWPELLYLLVDMSGQGNRLQDRQATLEKVLCDSSKMGEIREKFGLHMQGPRDTLMSLAALGEPTSEDDLAMVGELDPNRVKADLRWAELLGLARQAGGNNWVLDPLVQRLMKP
jgi:hypothetical protein